LSPTAVNRKPQHFHFWCDVDNAGAALSQARYSIGQPPPIKIGGMTWFFQETS
jgi:hypothetical protein